MSLFRYNTGKGFNQLGSVKYNSPDVLVNIQQVTARIGPRPVVLDQDYNTIAILENSFDVFIDQEVNGMDELSFSIPYTDPKAKYCVNENVIQMFDTLYVIRLATKRKGLDSPTLEIQCEAIWYDIQYADSLGVKSWNEVDATTMFNDILAGTGWSLGVVEVTSKRSMEITDIKLNRLAIAWKAQTLYGADLDFNTSTRKLNVLIPNSTHSGVAIMYGKNMKDMEARYDTRDLITKLYVFGKDGLTIESANNGKGYVENYSYTSKVRIRTLQDDRFTNPFTLLDYANQQLDVLSKPIGYYKLSLLEMSRQTNLSHEKFTLGDIVRIYDKDIDCDVDVRIMKWKYNVVQPELSQAQLETKLKGIAELLANNNPSSVTAVSSNAVDKSEMLDLMVFNYLLNSRADDGFSYWSNTGWIIDAANGYSGNASFKAVGEFGVTKSMKQIVYPSHRDTYALSFRAYVENLVKGNNAKVGINIKVTYDDNTTEEVFVSLI